MQSRTDAGTMLITFGPMRQALLRVSSSWNQQHQPDQPTTGTLSSNRVVVFADMLGFAALTEANPIDPRMLHAHSRFPQTLEAA